MRLYIDFRGFLTVFRLLTDCFGRPLSHSYTTLTAPPELNFSPDGVPLASVELPLFGRMRQDTSVESLIGTKPIPPIELPVELTKSNYKHACYSNLNVEHAQIYHSMMFDASVRSIRLLVNTITLPPELDFQGCI